MELPIIFKEHKGRYVPHVIGRGDYTREDNLKRLDAFCKMHESKNGIMQFYVMQITLEGKDGKAD